MAETSVPEFVNTYEGRVVTFKAVHHLAKRRASTTKKKVPTTAEWPHQTPTAEDMATAGFYYAPISESLDNTKCFHCNYMLDGWEQDDDPVREHIKLAPSCGFAVMIASSRRSDGDILDADGQENPMRPELVEARQATFADQWPYESKKGWRCKTKKMVDAGFCFEPNHEDEDNVKCYYCNLVLGGWEPKDDPHAEHARRRPDCNFFLLSEKFKSQQKATKGKKAGARASKASRVSTQSNFTTFSEAPSMMSLGEGLDMDGDSVLTAISSAPKGRKTGKAKAATTRKASKAQKKPAAEEPRSEAFSEVETQQDPSVIFVDPEPPAKRTRRAVSRAEPSQLESMITDIQPTRKASRTVKPRAKPKGKPRVSEDASQLQSELHAAIEASVAEIEILPKATRGKKRTSDGTEKIDSSAIMMAEPAEVLKPKKVRQPKKQATKPQEPESEPPTEEVDDELEESEPAPVEQKIARKPVPKAKKGKKAAKQSLPLEPDMEVDVLDLNEEDVVHSQVIHKEATGTPEPSHSEPSPTPSTPTPARHSTAPVRRSLPSAKPAVPVHKAMTPPSSPQSSDAENKPPSSRPSTIHRPAASTAYEDIRVPLAASTPNISPSKRSNFISMTSTVPWSPTDVENIFLASPVKAAYINDAWLASDKENAQALANLKLDKVATNKSELKEVVKRVKNGLTQDEKAMSVEQWIRWNAGQQTERLRRECEALVMVFEKEGNRAMNVIESIDAV